MDANGTRYHLLLGKDDWACCLDDRGRQLQPTLDGTSPDPAPLWFHPERHELTLAPRLFLYVASTNDAPAKLEERRGAACDRYGNWYYIDPSMRKVRVFSSGSRLATDFWPVEQPAPPPARPGAFGPEKSGSAPAAMLFGGLAVTEDHYLVTGLINPPGLLVFDLYGGGAPTQFNWPAHIPFTPFDMAAMPDGGVWILDREHRCYWAIGRQFDVITDDKALPPVQREGHPKTFQAITQSEGDARYTPSQAFFPTQLTLDSSMPLDCHDPIAIEALPDCTVLILDRGPKADFSTISRYRYSTRLGNPVSTQIMQATIETSRQADFKLVAHDFAFVPAHEGPDGPLLDRLYITSATGNQTFAFNIAGDDTQLSLSPLAEEYMPMRLFGGKALVTVSSQVYYDVGERWLPLMRRLHPRYAPDASFSHNFDSQQPGCIWHRLMLDACIPPDTQVQVWSRAADQEKDLDASIWQLERCYRRSDGSELPFVPDPFQPAPEGDGEVSLVPTHDKAAGAGTWEMLFQRAEGRFLQLRIRLASQGQHTPRLHALRIYYPRFSYLQHYLPAVYREDGEPASFLDRFLANQEGFYTAIEDKITNVRQLFDPATTPPDVLDWLAGWFGIALDPGWSEYRRRLFIRHAMLFFQYRGTLHGLCMALHLALDTNPGEHIFHEVYCGNARSETIRIIEMFLMRKFPAVVLGDPTDLTSAVTVTGTPIWRPSDGGASLEDRYRAATGTEEPYPLRDPGGDQSQTWRAFSLEHLGFLPAGEPGDVLLWQTYLLHTYGTIERYNRAYNLAGDRQLSSFNEALLPESLPADGRALDDWLRFQTRFLPTVCYAHQFFVLLPMPEGARPDSLVYQQRLSLAKKMIDLEKPAHTTYHIKFYWDMFRVGAARLGLDSFLDLGSRSPQLLPPMVLGQGYLGQGTLGDHHPQDMPNRMVLECSHGPQFLSDRAESQSLPDRAGPVKQVTIRNRPLSGNRPPQDMASRKVSERNNRIPTLSSYAESQPSPKPTGPAKQVKTRNRPRSSGCSGCP